MKTHEVVERLSYYRTWITPENFVAGKITFDCIDEPELKVPRMYVSQLQGGVSVFDIENLVATHEGVKRFSARHELGLFKQDQYIKALRKTGFDVSFQIKIMAYSTMPFTLELYTSENY